MTLAENLYWLKYPVIAARSPSAGRIDASKALRRMLRPVWRGGPTQDQEPPGQDYLVMLL